MLTFDEFFMKKRIDLELLERGRPELFEEFSMHYPVMGEKSFDHTKKYWFNRLRKEFPLSEEKVARLAKSTAPKPLETPSGSGSATSKPVGFTPRFKAKATSPETDTPEKEKAAKPPAGFKPRFKAGATPATKPTEERDDKPQTPESAEKPSKPLGFKPRFKAGATPATKPTEERDDSSQIPESAGNASTEAKPLGFKPRFKPAPPGKPDTDEGKSADA